MPQERFNPPDFRRLACEAVERAKLELASGCPHRLRYAALELRGALEALTYDRALAYKNEIPPTEYRTWQPSKLLAVLAEIDPTTVLTSTLAIAFEGPDGEPIEPFREIGTDNALSVADVKIHYHRLGAHLHMPSLDQLMRNAKPDSAKLEVECRSIVGIIETVLSSRIWNNTTGMFSTLPQCMNEQCRKPLRRRVPPEKTQLNTKCECGADYILTRQGDGQILWTPQQQTVPCGTENCDQEISIWQHDVRPGTYWTCQGCGVRYQISLGIETLRN